MTYFNSKLNRVTVAQKFREYWFGAFPGRMIVLSEWIAWT